jgi:hypothetical protein
MGDAGTQGNAEPGFGETEGTEALPDMRDTLPTFNDSYGQDDPVAGVPRGNDTGGGETGEQGNNPTGDFNTSATAGTVAVGTRSDGGFDGGVSDDVDASLEPGQGPLTGAEQVAILDRQLEQSTSDFDAMILEEQQRQREMDRQRPQRTPRAEAEPAGAGSGGRNPYEDNVAMGGSATGGGIGGGMGGGRAGAPDNPAIYKAPDDIPAGDNDDVVARQLREAAMREPDPAVRERLWNEYRKYTGLEIPNP